MSTYPKFQIDLEMTSLSPRQRELLQLEGVVTEFLSARFDEPITATKLDQGTVHVTERRADLDYTGEVMTRSVILCGVNSGTSYLHAKARLAIERLPHSVCRDLVATSTPLGRLLVRDGLDTSRELMRSGTCSSPHLAELFDIPKQSTWLWRTYRILAGALPIAHIREQFPVCGPI